MINSVQGSCRHRVSFLNDFINFMFLIYFIHILNLIYLVYFMYFNNFMYFIPRAVSSDRTVSLHQMTAAPIVRSYNSVVGYKIHFVYIMYFIFFITIFLSYDCDPL